MIIGIFMIIAGIWLIRIAKRVADQQRRELFAHWELQNKIIGKALHQIDLQKIQSIGKLEILSVRFSRIEQSERNKKESVLRDFKRMFYKQ